MKHKFKFYTPRKDPKLARHKCVNKQCPWKVIAYLNKHDANEVIVDLVPRGRPKKERFRNDEICGLGRESAALQLIEPAGEGDDDVWVPYYCSTYGGREHSVLTTRLSDGENNLILREFPRYPFLIHAHIANFTFAICGCSSFIMPSFPQT